MPKVTLIKDHKRGNKTWVKGTEVEVTQEFKSALLEGGFIEVEKASSKKSQTQKSDK